MLLDGQHVQQKGQSKCRNGKGEMGKQGIETLALGTTTQVVSCKTGQKSVHVVQISLSILC